MPTCHTWRVSRHVLTASIALIGLLLVVAGVHAQEQPETPDGPPDHYFYQFHGIAQDVTIDGEPLQEGDSITPILNGEPVKTAMIAENGFFLTFKQDFNLPPIGECHVAYLIDSQRHKEPLLTDEFSYPMGCGEIEVKLALVTANGNVAIDDGSQDAVEVAADSDEPEDMLQSESADDDMLEEAQASDDSSAEPEQSSTEATVSDGVAPDTPNLGTGGLKAAESDPKWSVVVAMVVLIVAGIACALLIMKRRKDQSPR